MANILIKKSKNQQSVVEKGGNNTDHNYFIFIYLQ